MPLFFLIAIGAGATQSKQFAYSAPVEPQPQQAMMAPSFDASVYASTTDCLNAAALQGVSTTACQR